MSRLIVVVVALFFLAFGEGLAQIGKDHIVVRVFLDSNCDGFYHSSVDRPLPDVPVVFDNAAAPQLVETNEFGLSWIGRFTASELATMTVTTILPLEYKGFGLTPCEGQPATMGLSTEDFKGRNVKSAYLRFGVRLLLSPKGE